LYYFLYPWGPREGPWDPRGIYPGIPGDSWGSQGGSPLGIQGGASRPMGLLNDPGPGAQGLKADGPQGPGPRGPDAFFFSLFLIGFYMFFI